MVNVGSQLRKNISRNISRATGVKRSTSSSTSSYNTKKQAENYETRLRGAGVNPEDVTDNRSWLEKALNLEKDQNILFDIFELINRPQNALFTGISNALQGDDFFEGLGEGITGKKKTSGKDLLVNAGMEDKEGLDLSDVLGFGLDVFADPMDIPFIPVSAAGKAGKALSKVDNVADVAKSSTKLISPTQGLFQLAGKGIKGAAKLADTGVEKALGAVDNKILRNATKYAEETGDTVANVFKKFGGKSDLLGDYKALKKGVTNSLDSSKMLGGLIGKTRISGNKVDLAEALSNAKKADLEKITKEAAQNIAEKTGRNADDVFNEISKNLTRYIEYEQDTAIDGANFLKNISSKNKQNVFKGTKESVDNLAEALGKYDNIKFKIADDGKSLVINTKKSKNLQAFKDNPDVQKLFSKLDLKKDLGYTEQQLKELGQIGKQFGKGGELENIYKSHKNAYNEVADIYKKYTGVDFSDITKREGYLKRAPGDLVEDTEKIGPGFGKGTTDTKTFGSRKYTTPAEVTNIQKQEEIATNIKKTEKNIETATNQLSYNKREILESQMENAELKLEGKLKKYNDNLAKLGNKQEKIRGSLDNISKIRNEVVTKLDDKTIKNIQNIKDASLASSISKASTDVNNYTKEYNELIKKLSDTDLTEKEIKSLSKKVDTLSGKMEIAQRRLNTKLDAVNNFTNSRTDMLLKNTHSALAKSENIAVRESKLTSQLGETLEKTNQLRQAQEDVISHFDKVIDNLDMQIKGINPANDKKILEKIKRLENKKVILSSQQGKDLFNLDYYAGLDTFINQASSTAKGVSVYNDALAMGSLYNKDYIKFADEITGDIPRGFSKVNGDVLASQFENAKSFLPENSDALKALAEDFRGKTLYIDKDFARLMKVTNTSKQEANALVKLVDSFNNTFKKYKILSPGFQVRNVAGNATNMVLSGMPAGKIPEYWGKAANVLNSSDDLLAKVANGIELTGKDADNWKLLQQFYEGGFKDAGTKLQDLEQLRAKVSGKKGVLNKLTEANAKLNESMDSLNRMALLMYANDTPKYIEKLGKSNAIEAVKYALMDPSNMSTFEKGVMKKIIPFYTFTKQNLLFQATNIMKNTPRYNRLIKGINSIYNNLDENEYYKYQKEGMQIPLPITDGNGNRLFLKTNLPLSDLGEWMESPLQRTVSATSPVIRTPFEMVTGQNIFTGQDANYNALSNAYQTITGNKPSSGVSNLMGKAEQILSGLGVDTISTNLVKKVNAVVKKYNGNMDSQAMWAEIFRSILQNTNQEKIENSKVYENLEAYQNYIKQLKNQGINIPTIKELNNQSKRTLRRVQNRRNKT